MNIVIGTPWYCPPSGVDETQRGASVEMSGVGGLGSGRIGLTLDLHTGGTDQPFAPPRHEAA
jgi:hypothetical protein